MCPTKMLMKTTPFAPFKQRYPLSSRLLQQPQNGNRFERTLTQSIPGNAIAVNAITEIARVSARLVSAIPAIAKQPRNLKTRKRRVACRSIHHWSMLHRLDLRLPSVLRRSVFIQSTTSWLPMLTRWPKPSTLAGSNRSCSKIGKTRRSWCAMSPRCAVTKRSY